MFFDGNRPARRSGRPSSWPSRCRRAGASRQDRSSGCAAAPGGAARIERTRRPSARTRAPARAEAARPRAGRTAGARRAGPAIFARPRFADRQRTAVEHLTVELLNRLLGLRAVEKLDERKTARPARLAVDRQDDLEGGATAPKYGAQIGFSGGVGQIADEQADSQSSLP